MLLLETLALVEELVALLTVVFVADGAKVGPGCVLLNKVPRVALRAPLALALFHQLVANDTVLFVTVQASRDPLLLV